MMKQKNKIVLLMVAVIAIGAFSLPSMLSATGISHEYVNGNDIACSKCHKGSDEIAGAIANSSLTMYGTESPGNSSDTASLNAKSADGYHIGQIIHGNMTNGCKECHTLTSTAGEIDTIAEGSHTMVSYPDCTTCHGHVLDEIKAPGSDVHKGFQLEAEAVGDNDAACIGCHTQSDIQGYVTYNMNRNTLTMYGTLSFGNGP